MLEAVIATAMIVRAHHLRTPPGPVPLATGITLRPAAPAPCTLLPPTPTIPARPQHTVPEEQRMPRTQLPTALDERTMLATFLDYTRATVRAKCEHLAEADARRAPLPSSPLMTISGLVSHLRWMEYYWFQVMLGGEEDRGPWTDEDPDREMRIAVQIPLAELLDQYETQCARSRELVAALNLDTPSRRTISTGEPVILRWILLHVIEETARHNGHLDLLRELADGVTGT